MIARGTVRTRADVARPARRARRATPRIEIIRRGCQQASCQMMKARTNDGQPHPQARLNLTPL
jgi:hypothetical protein